MTRTAPLLAAALASACVADDATPAPVHAAIAREALADELGVVHTRLQQTIDGIPVLGGEAIVHDGPRGRTVTDAFLGDLALPAEAPLVDADDAIELALQAWEEAGGDRATATRPPETAPLIVRGDDRDHLTVRVTLERIDGRSEPTRPVYLVDAHDGRVVASWDEVRRASGASLYSGTRSVASQPYAGSHVLEDLARREVVLTAGGGTTGTQYVWDSDDVYSAASQRPAVDAAWGMAVARDYFFNMHGRNGLDGQGGPTSATGTNGAALLTAVVHYGARWPSAAWTGDRLLLGDGDGSQLGAMVALDVIGHELTHGVIQATARLGASGEPGALAESFADVFGTSIEAYAFAGKDAWKLGEEVLTPGVAGDAVRYLDDPSRGGGATSYSTSLASIDVHDAAGVGNKAFYLVVTGGVARGKAERIWYRALTVYMTSTTSYQGARSATIQAAADLYGAASPEVGSVTQAWLAVGVR